MPDFVVADPARTADTLTHADVHAWLLPHERGSGRRALRRLLAAYLSCAPAQVTFVEQVHGRPSLAAPHAHLDFNWSHSAGHALVALAQDLPELGVDLEASRPRPRALALAQRFFSADEYAGLAALPAAQREPAFLRLWTAKEAVLKGLGRGLAFGLHRVTFTLDGEIMRARDFQAEAGPAAAWQLHMLAPSCGQACTAWRGPARKLHLYRAAWS